jgi:6-phosphogluconolactonase (cycloisomerase 2 family)
VGPIITLNGDRTVTMTAGEDYTDLGATADGDEKVTVDTSNLDTNAVGTYTVSYSATETRDNVDYTRVENRFVKVVAPESVGIISSWTLKDTISDPYGLNAGFAFDGSASISGDGAWISIGSEDDGGGSTLGHGNVFIYSKNTDITYSKTQDIAGSVSEYYFGKKTKLSRDGNYLCVIQDYYGSGSYFQMFERTNNTWNSIASSIQFSALVRGVTLSEDATYIVISNNDNVDEVKVYEKSADNTVTLMTYINPPEDSLYGAQSVSISDNGELLCFGTPGVESNTGNVYVYTRTSSSWSTNPTAVIQAPATGGYFGYDVSMSGDGNFIAVGALGSDRVYIYKRSGTSWSLSSTINGPSGYGFGTSVSLSQYGDYLAVGSFYASGSFTGDHVWAYYKDDTDVWTLVQTFTGDTGTNFGYDVEISSGGNYILVTADQATANAYVYFGAGGEWVPGYTTVSVTLGDKLQPNMSSLTRGQKYVFDFSQTRGKDFRLSLDGTTELTSGVIEAENTLVYTLLSSFFFPQLYYYSPNTPGIGGSFSVLGTLDDGVIYFDGNGNLRATNITSLTRDVSNVFYFSSEYGTKIALSTSLDGANLIDGISNTETSLTVTLPLYYPFSTIFLKSLDTQNIGSSLSVTGTLGDGVIYFDGDGNLRATNITTLTRDVSNVFYFSSEYGTEIALSTSLNGANLIDGISNTETSLTVTLPFYYPFSTIFLKSLNTSEIGSSLSVLETTGTIYFDGDGNLRVTNITRIYKGQEYTFYFSSDYGTRVLLSLTEDGNTFEQGVTSNTDTSLVFTIPTTISNDIIYIKSPTTQGIGSSIPTSVLETKLTADGGVANDEFGYSVSISSDGLTAIVGAYADESFKGSAYIFKYANGIWTETKLTADDGVANDEFGYSVSISSDGLTAIVGAYSDESSKGSAYIFKYANGIWTETKLTASDGVAYEEFGYSVSISGDGLTAIVGAYADESSKGSAYIFKYANGIWTETKLKAGDGVANDRFGYSVSISSDGLTAIVGAYRDESSRGSAYIFKYANGIWTETKLTAGDPAVGDYFGYSVSISDDGLTAIVGAYRDDSFKGSAYIFKYANGSWSQKEKLTANDRVANDRFGYSVSISGDGLTAIVGADGDDGVSDNLGNSGSAYIFKYANGRWSQKEKLTAGDPAVGDYFGYSVSISDDGLTAIVGAYRDDSFKGSAYIYNYL